MVGGRIVLGLAFALAHWRWRWRWRWRWCSRWRSRWHSRWRSRYRHKDLFSVCVTCARPVAPSLNHPQPPNISRTPRSSPILTLYRYAPMHWPMLGFFSFLNFYLHGVRFDRILPPPVPLHFTPLLRLKRFHACDQWHASRVSPASYRYLCKLCSTTEATVGTISDSTDHELCHYTDDVTQR
jgi:hypothetical protein